MITLRTTLSFLTAFVISLTPCPAAEDDGPTPSGRVLELHKMPHEEFGKVEKLKTPIDFDNIDLALLDAAVFHETNRHRVENDLPPLGFEPVLREAAAVQVRGMIRMQEVSHKHPDADKKTLSDRFELLEIDTDILAENVAMVFGIRYESGTDFYKRRKAGGLVFSEKPDGPPIPPHTYASFSEALLVDWMASPGHRRNILRKSLRTLGTSSLHDKSALGMDTFYSAQEFAGQVTVQQE
jgi:uncharacterized protein YkwD